MEIIHRDYIILGGFQYALFDIDVTKIFTWLFGMNLFTFLSIISDLEGFYYEDGCPPLKPSIRILTRSWWGAPSYVTSNHTNPPIAASLTHQKISKCLVEH